MEGWFYFDDTAQVKEIKVVMKDVAKNAFVYETTKTVDYQLAGQPARKAPEKLEGTTRIPGYVHLGHRFGYDRRKFQVCRSVVPGRCIAGPELGGS